MQIIDDLAQRLESLVISCRINPPSHINGELRNAIAAASHALDILAVDLRPSDSILPRKKMKITPNQHSWPETRNVMGVPVKSKKRKDYGPYGGNEQSGKRTKSDARGPSLLGFPSDDMDLLTSTVTDTSSSSGLQPLSESSSSYYRPRPNIPNPAPTPSMPITQPARPPSMTFDVEGFDLSDDKALERLSNKQLRALCSKYDVDTARSNDDLIKNLRMYHKNRQHPPPPPPMSHYQYYQPMYYPAMYYTQKLP
ncbi:hypothetical protein B0H10DRAFT_1952169 [Mycena sp. CBHHK59/15]|nr:hypothetical protein B0H10DRAFT_1952169 [Mycena sp. CBHHK59/15]